MKFRTRLLVAFLLGALVPMTVLALVVRNEMTSRLTAQSQRRVDALAGVIEGDLARERDTVHAALAQVRNAIAADNRFRRAVVDRAESERRYLLDYAGGAMRLAGLSMLQIQDETGHIMSSGHFRNDYDRPEPELPTLLTAAPDRTALVRVRTAGDPMLVLAGVDSIVVGNRRLTLVGGVAADVDTSHGLPSEDALHVALILPSDSVIVAGVSGTTAAVASAETIVRELRVPFIDWPRHGLGLATFQVSHDLSELRDLRRSVDRWFVVAVALTALLVVVLASWLASRVSRPVVELAEKTARVDLDRLDVEFDTRRVDEIGTLATGLAAMTGRLRESASQLKDAERRATMGELARQVNHDLKNGLTPIRNVFRHLVQHAEQDPAQLPDVLRERQNTIDASISYLENLASNYARLSRRGTRERCDLSEIVQRVVGAKHGAGSARLETRLADGAVLDAEPLSLRRIVENLVDNAVDSLGWRDGRVMVSTEVVAGGADGARVRLTVEDTGVGMSEEQRSRIFDDFYTTKAEGSGLGLSIVRRLVMDLDGTVTVASELGKGSRFVVDLPAGKT